MFSSVHFPTLQGVHPDASCTPPGNASGPAAGPTPLLGETHGVVDASFLAGLPLGLDVEAAMASRLAKDPCILAAERLLAKQGQQPQQPAMASGVATAHLAMGHDPAQ